MSTDAINMMAREVTNLRAEISDLKQQLHAYKQYHDARDEWCRAEKRQEWVMKRDTFYKANAELQLLRSK